MGSPITFIGPIGGLLYILGFGVYKKLKYNENE